MRRGDLTEGFFFRVTFLGDLYLKGHMYGMAHFRNVMVIFHLATFRGKQSCFSVPKKYFKKSNFYKS